MDYKYIEQLLERYWESQTTLEEEAILRTFFRQEDVPASLLPYRQLFVEEDEMAGEHLPDDFADRMLRIVDERSILREEPDENYVCKARRLTMVHRLRPFYRAAGLIAIMLTIGNAAHQSFTNDSINPSPTSGKEEIIVENPWPIETSPEQQSAELTPQPTDTLDTFTR